MLCCSEQCDRKNQCGLFYRNPQPEYRKHDNVESLATHGWSHISVQGYEDHYDCGPLGDYKMFEPLIQSKKYIEKEPLLAYLENMGISKYIIDSISQENKFPTVSNRNDYSNYCDLTFELGGNK